MSNIVFAGNSCRHVTNAFPSLLSSLAIGGTRAASLNSAIGRGLRRSKGVGFRGKERIADKSTENPPARDGPVRRTVDGPLLSNIRGQLTHDAWRKENTTSTANKGESSSLGSMLRLRRGKKDIGDDKNSPKRRSRAARFNDPNHGFGKRSLERRRRKGSEAEVQYKGRGIRMKIARHGSDSEVNRGRRKPHITAAAQRAAESDRVAQIRNPGGSKLSKGRLAFLARIAASPSREAPDRPAAMQDYAPILDDFEQALRKKEVGPRSTAAESQPRFRESRFVEDSLVSHPTLTKVANDRLPLSIPYTTPASEFLYGTSVVEAALRSHRDPRRKLYKLYVYTGENREHANRDASIERLARKSGVQVIHADASWLRLLDKMSGGRPHNGYILEASPLPKLPITSLGELGTQGGKPGFLVSLDYQSREEAVINGTENFIPLPCAYAQGNGSGRKPLVLLLDSILDPGNLGGIIRTASFIGVTAIAISSRNSASFSPVVLKASAGACENVTLFSVSKPAGFIVDSKAKGWKVYAAVAPPSSPSSALSGGSTVKSSVKEQITTDELKNPLENDPVILMLGSEGEGLRWGLRSKADVEVAIPRHNGGGVDSLNVSVAAGILCHAFLRREASAFVRVEDRMRDRKGNGDGEGRGVAVSGGGGHLF